MSLVSHYLMFVWKTLPRELQQRIVGWDFVIPARRSKARLPTCSDGTEAQRDAT